MIVGEGIGMKLNEFIRPAAPARGGQDQARKKVAEKKAGCK